MRLEEDESCLEETSKMDIEGTKGLSLYGGMD
jgi:hypothetical protein